MTLPFTYCITHIQTNKRYYGCRYAIGCHPNDLGTTYFTSSKIMKSIIISEGLENFSFEIRKTFSSVEKCRSWEHRVLTKLDAAKSEKWFNRHNGGEKFCNIKHSDETRKRYLIRINVTVNLKASLNPKKLEKQWLKQTAKEHSRKNSGRNFPNLLQAKITQCMEEHDKTPLYI
jgi:hypothetical protein